MPLITSSGNYLPLITCASSECTTPKKISHENCIIDPAGILGVIGVAPLGLHQISLLCTDWLCAAGDGVGREGGGDGNIFGTNSISHQLCVGGWRSQ